ncbi:MAG: Lrp/AsnC ligand binding domain-containing protein [Pseudomonadota bacterium]
MSAPLAIDDTDTRILRLLQDDARMPNLTLAKAVNLSPAAAHERVRRLTREGFILGYEAVLNPALLGSGLLVFVEVQLDAMGVGLHAAFKKAVHARPEILECHEVAGNFDYLIKTRVADMAAYRELVARVVWSLPGVRGVRTYAAMEELKSTAKIPL